MSATRQPIVHNLESPTTEVTMTSTRNASIRNRIISNPGRVAGLWYLLLVFLGPLRLMYIPNTLFVSGNAAATVNNIAAHQLLLSP